MTTPMRFDRLQTDRLVLRRWQESDRAPFAALNADPETMRFFPGTLDRAASDALIETLETRFDRQGFGFWALEVAATGAFIGFTGLNPLPHGVPGAGGLEVGWRLARHAWHQGYATEAARAALGVAFDGLGLPEIWSLTAVRNAPSQAVMRRLGLTETARFDHPRIPPGDPLRPQVAYRLTAPGKLVGMRRFRPVLVIVLAGVLLATACDGEDGNGRPAASPARSVAPTAPAAVQVGRYTLPLGTTEPTGLAWSPDGDTLVAVARGTVAVFTGPLGAPPLLLRVPGDAALSAVAWSPDGARFATLSADGQLLLWRPGEAQPVGALHIADGVPGGDLSWAPGGARIAVSIDRTVHVVDVTGTPVETARSADLTSVRRVAWAPDGNTVYAATLDRAVRLSGGTVVGEAHEPLVTTWFAVAVAADGRVATAARVTGEEVLRVYDGTLTTGGPPLPLPRGARNTTTIRFSPDGRYLCAAFGGKVAYVWQLDGAGGRLVAGYHGHDGAGRDIRGLSWQPGTRRIATLDETGLVHVWELPA